MSDCRTLSREFLQEFIDLYRELPCLWQVKSKEYLDKNKKNEAYAILVKKLQMVQPNATKASVVTKINSLRGGFRREHKKVIDSTRSGAGADAVYVPSLWYYNLLMFVRDQDIPRKSTSNILSDGEDIRAEGSSPPEEEDDIFADSEVETNDDTQAQLDVDLLSPSSATTTDSTHVSSVLSVPNRALLRSSSKKRLRTRKSNAVVDKADEILNVVSARLTDPGDDEFSIIGKNVAAKLRKLPENTKIYTEKLINDLLFQAALGKITEHTKITTEIIQPTPHSNTFDHHQQNSHRTPSNDDDYQFLHFDRSSQNSTTGTYFSGFNPVFDNCRKPNGT